ncbi:MAG: chemotaxis protein CheW [Sideroxydans sp.]|nr:chemotaxis protein CheW [Sideroxydans sp.]
MDQPDTPETGWMPPSAALAQFEPPEGAHLAAGGEVRKEVRARYGFRVGDLGLLIDPDAGSEVLAMPVIATLPGTPPGFLGLINLRGNLVPLYELGDLLGTGSRRSGNLVLVFGQGELAVGVKIEGYPTALLALRPLTNLPQLPETLRKHVSAGFVQDETVWLEFDHGSFFDEVCRDIR